MIRPEQIPDEVVAAALKKRGLMREAIADALNAWPGMRVKAVLLADTVLLPLPTEASDGSK